MSDLDTNDNRFRSPNAYAEGWNRGFGSGLAAGILLVVYGYYIGLGIWRLWQ